MGDPKLAINVQNMKRNKLRKIISAVMFSLSIVLSWGGMIYATNDPEHFKLIGVIIALVGYGIFFGSALIYETITE